MVNAGKYSVQCADGTEAIVTVIPVHASQLPQPPPGSNLEPQMATRMNMGNGQWTICISEEAGPEVLDWEMAAIRDGLTSDKV